MQSKTNTKRSSQKVSGEEPKLALGDIPCKFYRMVGFWVHSNKLRDKPAVGDLLNNKSMTC